MSSIRRMCVALLLWALGGTEPLRAQAAGARAGQDVTGRVVDAGSGRALPGAVVSLTQVGSQTEGKGVVAGEDGSFRFAGVPKGKWSLTGRKAGYVGSAYLMHDELSTAVVTGGEVGTEGLVLALQAEGKIAGSVLDERGDPVAQAQVQLFRVMPPGGDDPVRMTQIVATDTTGAFAFSVVPGTLYLSVRASPWYAVNPPAEAPDAPVPYRVAVDPALEVVYPQLYYPHARTTAEATPIEVHAGERVTADFEMTPERAVSLSVRLPAVTQGQAPVFPQLVQDQFGLEQPANVGQVQVVDGQVQISGIAPGQYALKLLQGGGSAGASEAVDLSGGSVTLEGIALPPHLNLTVQVREDAGQKAGQPPFLLLRRGRVQVGGEPVGETGEVTFKDLAAGDYTLHVVEQGRLLATRRLLVDGRVVPDFTLHLSGSELVHAVLEMAGRPVQVTGFVHRQGHPGPAAMVVLVPAGANTGKELFRRDQSDLDGSFSLPDVSPGNYVLVALDDGWALPWTDMATMLRYLPQGMAVTVPETGPAVLQLPRAVEAQPAMAGTGPASVRAASGGERAGSLRP